MNGVFFLFFRSVVLVCWGVLYESVLALLPHFFFCLVLGFFFACWFGGFLVFVWVFFFFVCLMGLRVVVGWVWGIFCLVVFRDGSRCQ